jgi:hydrogenase-4 component B
MIGLAPWVFWPALERAMNAWQPGWAGEETSVPLATLSGLHLALAVVAAVAACMLWRRARHRGFKRALTWDCGYAAPTARMQYTAGSFSGIITEWFAWILRPERHEHRPEAAFPAQASFSEHTPDAVLKHVVEPTASVVVRLSMVVRRLQHGRVQAYLFYILVGLAALALVSLLGGAR